MRRLRQNSNLAFELGMAALEPPQPFQHGPAHAVVCDLFRQAIYWALLAAAPSEQPSEAREQRNARDFDSVWESADRARLLRAAGTEAALEALGKALSSKSFADFAELPAAEAQLLADALRPFAEALLADLALAELAIERMWFERAKRVGGLLLVTLAAAIGVSQIRESLELKRDIAKGKPWTASSTYPSGCSSPQQAGEKCPNFFAHTLEESDPWLVFDLEKLEPISGVRVENRADCCAERAVPLVVEVSRDQRTWTEVARSNDEFQTFRASFPKVNARYVKFHIPRVTNLHFKGVQILR
jgi:hypothetical protein